MKKYLKSVEYIIAVSAVILGVTFLIGLKNQDVNFCRSVLNGMISGNTLIEKHLDWDNFIFFQMDIGTTYRRLPNEAERQNYKTIFIKHLSQSFSYSKAKISAFKNWRLLGQPEASAITVIAEGPNGKLLFTLVRLDGQRKIQSITLKRE